MSLKNVLDFMYDEERNLKIQSFFDAGWTFTLGDPTNGFSDSLQIVTHDLDSGADTFLQLYLALKGEEASLRWMQFESKRKSIQ